MASPQVTDFWMYRHRYFVGFGVSLIVICLLAVVMFYIPGGLSGQEMDSVVKSHYLDVSTIIHPSSLYQISQLPFLLLQKTVIHFFGVSTVSVKLPSIVIGLIAVLALYGVLKLWYRRNVAIIGGLIAGTSTSFLLTTQRADGSVLYILWPALILFFATYLAQPFRFKPVAAILLLVTVALGLYTPTVIYLLFALIVTGFIHPHARRTVRTQLTKAIPGVILFFILLEPLAVAFARQPSSVVDMLHLGHILPPTQWVSNLAPYWHINDVTSAVIATPIFSAPILLLALIGIYRLFSVKYTARSYFLTVWGVILIIVTAIAPVVAPSLFIWVLLLVAIGIDFIIRQWYKLFPLNPYARIAGLLPLAVLVSGIVLADIDAYIYGYHYSVSASQAYSPDLTLLRRTVSAQAASVPIDLLVNPTHRDFYQVYASTQHGHAITVIETPRSAGLNSTLIADSTTWQQLPASPSQIITSDASHDGARFYLYKKYGN